MYTITVTKEEIIDKKPISRDVPDMRSDVKYIQMYVQTVEDIDLVAVIKAINKIGMEPPQIIPYKDK